MLIDDYIILGVIYALVQAACYIVTSCQENQGAPKFCLNICQYDLVLNTSRSENEVPLNPLVIMAYIIAI